MKMAIALVAGTSVFASAAADEGLQAVESRASPAAFTALDKNADNQISKTEAGMDRTLSNVFAYVDTNGDGFISRTEFLAQDKTSQDAS